MIKNDSIANAYEKRKKIQRRNSILLSNEEVLVKPPRFSTRSSNTLGYETMKYHPYAYKRIKEFFILKKFSKNLTFKMPYPETPTPYLSNEKKTINNFD